MKTIEETAAAAVAATARNVLEILRYEAESWNDQGRMIEVIDWAREAMNHAQRVSVVHGTDFGERPYIVYHNTALWHESVGPKRGSRLIDAELFIWKRVDVVISVAGEYEGFEMSAVATKANTIWVFVDGLHIATIFDAWEERRPYRMITIWTEVERRSHETPVLLPGWVRGEDDPKWAVWVHRPTGCRFRVPIDEAGEIPEGV
jgi:hypothetical protein